MSVLRIVVADDHGVVRQGLRILLESEPDFRVVGQAGDGPTTLELAERLRPHVIVLDLMMPGLDGFEVMGRLRRRPGRMFVVVLSMHSAVAYVSEALRLGASAYVVKEASGEQLSRAIRQAAAGKIYLSPPLSLAAVQLYRERAAGTRLPALEALTPRERQVLLLAAEGLSAGEVAAQLAISRRTVEAHRLRVMHKLGLRSQTELVRHALALGLVPPPPRTPGPGGPRSSP